LVVIAIDGRKEGLEKVSGVEWWAGPGSTAMTEKRIQGGQEIGLKRRCAASSVLIPHNKRQAARPAQG
jgi:hypothetical protein